MSALLCQATESMTSCDICMNTIEPSIRFTHEAELDSALPFLDTLVHHPDGSLSTSVYRKPSHTDKYLNPVSHQSPAQKAAVFHTLYSRALTHSSSSSSFTQENDRFFRALSHNDYPSTSSTITSAVAGPNVRVLPTLHLIGRVLWPCHTSGVFPSH